MQNLRDSGNFEFFESLAAEITEAIKHKVKNLAKVFANRLDFALKYLEQNNFKAEHLQEWPDLKKLLIKRRSLNFRDATIKMNREAGATMYKKEMPATVENLENHIKQSIETGGLPPYEKLFNFSKKNKEDPPLTGFIEYFAYRASEQDYNLRQDLLNPDK